MKSAGHNKTTICDWHHLEPFSIFVIVHTICSCIRGHIPTMAIIIDSLDFSNIDDHLMIGICRKENAQPKQVYTHVPVYYEVTSACLCMRSCQHVRSNGSHFAAALPLNSVTDHRPRGSLVHLPQLPPVAWYKTQWMRGFWVFFPSLSSITYYYHHHLSPPSDLGCQILPSFFFFSYPPTCSAPR